MLPELWIWGFPACVGTRTCGRKRPRVPTQRRAYLCAVGGEPVGSGAERAVTAQDKAGDEHTDLVHPRGSVAACGANGDLRWWSWA